MKSTNSGDDRATDVQRWYSGYLSVKNLPSDVARQLEETAEPGGVFDVSPTAIEIEYKGRDTSRVVVRALIRLAHLIGYSDGEVRCEISGDTDELWFEFYRIRDGRLYRQRGEVIRHPEEEVNESSL